MTSFVAESGGQVPAEERGVMSAYDAAAPAFERHRALPESVPPAVRAAVLAAVAAPAPRLLDLGAGTGRFGRPFVAAGDDYVGVDLSLGMLHEFARHGTPPPRLAQADGEHLPFADAVFDVVLMVQVFGGMRGWRRVLAETRRVLRPHGALMIGRVVAPADGLDARLKQRLAEILAEHRVATERRNVREDVEHSLSGLAERQTTTVATWSAERTPRRYIERQRTGARFALLPRAAGEAALAALASWAIATFGGLDAVVRETHVFELQTFTFVGDAAHA
jgi:ubiquinone/menaquinone biosynthesis C-methylase UbiE